MNEIVETKIENLNGELYVSSRDIAKGLGKEHRNVMRDLDKIIKERVCSDLSIPQNIVKSTYINYQNKQEYNEYLLTKDGFTLYMFNVQGYNDFKMAYINRFNEMEKALQEITMIENTKANLLLSIYNGGQEGVVASKELVELETKPLIEKIENDKPMVALAETRLDKGSCISITDATKSLGLKKGQITKWAKKEGYLHKSNKCEVNKKGEDYFKVYEKGKYRYTGILENGYKLISENIKEIKKIKVKEN